MAKHRITTLTLVALWTICSLPYFSAVLLAAHGDHRITSEIGNGPSVLIFHHEAADHHQSGQHHTSKDSDHHVATISADVATFPSPTPHAVAKYSLINSIPNVLIGLTRLFPLFSSRYCPSSLTKTIPSYSSFYRTIVLLV